MHNMLMRPELYVVKRIQAEIRRKKCLSGLDIGCGSFSVLTDLRPILHSTGIDASISVIENARKRNLHDAYVVGDVNSFDFGDQKFDVVVANEVIEHLDKWKGWALLERIENLSKKLVIITTPNGFLPQGAEFNNPWQRHKSGWFSNDFIGLGYDVVGILGPRFMRGYANQIKWRGSRLWTPLSELLGKLLTPWPGLYAGLLAIKDIEGVPAQLRHAQN